MVHVSTRPLSFSLSLYLFIYLFAYLPIYLPIYLSICLPIFFYPLRYFAFIFLNKPPAVCRRFTEATPTVNITGTLCIFRKNRATSLLYLYTSIYIVLLHFSLSLSHPRCFSNFLEPVSRKVNLLYAPCAKQIRPLSARQTRDCLNHRARAAEKGLRRMKSADITKICLWRRVSADTVISLVEVISEASCRLTGVSEIFPGLCPTMRAAFKAASSLYSRLKQQPLDIAALTFGPSSPPCQRSPPDAYDIKFRVSQWEGKR